MLVRGCLPCTRRRIVISSGCFQYEEVSMKRGLVLGILLLAGSLSVAVMGFQGPPAGQGGGARAGGPGAPQALQTIKVRDNLYMIANAGGNTAVFIMANGVSARGYQESEQRSGDSRSGSNGHPQADHDGDQHAHPRRPYRQQRILHRQRAFVAHENTKANMEKMTNFAGTRRSSCRRGSTRTR